MRIYNWVNIKIKLYGKIKSYNVYNGLKKIFFFQTHISFFTRTCLLLRSLQWLSAFHSTSGGEGCFSIVNQKSVKLCCHRRCLTTRSRINQLTFTVTYKLREGNHSSEYMLLLLSSAFYIYLAYKDDECAKVFFKDALFANLKYLKVYDLKYKRKHRWW